MAHMRVYLLVKLMNSIVLHQSTSLFTHDFLQTTSGFYLHLLSAQQLLQQQTLIFSTADLAPATVTDNSIILIDNSAQLVYKPLDCHTHPLFIASGWACGYPNGFSQILVTVLPSSISCLQLKKLGQVRSRTWANTASYLQMRLRTCKCGFFATNPEQYFFVWTCKALSESIYFVHISKKSAGPGQMRLWLVIDFHWLVVCKCSCCVSQVQRPYLLRWAQNPARKKYKTTQHNTRWNRLALAARTSHTCKNEAVKTSSQVHSCCICKCINAKANADQAQTKPQAQRSAQNLDEVQKSSAAGYKI